MVNIALKYRQIDVAQSQLIEILWSLFMEKGPMTFDDLRMDVLEYVLDVHGRNDIHSLVDELTKNVSPEAGEAVMTIKEIGRKEGLEQGVGQGKREIVMNFIKSGMSLGDIAKYARMELADVNALLEY